LIPGALEQERAARTEDLVLLIDVGCIQNESQGADVRVSELDRCAADTDISG
jgi:hypothetical protein